MGFAYESLVKSVLKRHGAELGDETMVQGMLSTVIVLKRSMGWRLLWPSLDFACVVIPYLAPFSLIIGSYGLAT